MLTACGSIVIRNNRKVKNIAGALQLIESQSLIDISINFHSCPPEIEQFIVNNARSVCPNPELKIWYPIWEEEEKASAKRMNVFGMLWSKCF